MKITHIGIHPAGNAGDTLLFPLVRDLFDQTFGPIEWTLEMPWATYVEKLNQADAIIIGGGGMFLRDTMPNKNSGWEWNCPIDFLQRIEKPIIVFAVGYNRFRGQEDFDPIFTDHIRLLVEKAKFFGLRNSGSMRMISNYLPEISKPKVLLQPCPTTIYKHLHMLPDMPDCPKQLALNIAYDRKHLRYGNDEERIFRSIASAIKYAHQNGWKIFVVSHIDCDTVIERYINVPFEKVSLAGRPASEIVDFYSCMRLTIGARGHSQMIPFGLGRPIISLISHNKMSYFLEDIGHSEWGIEVKDPQLKEKLIALIPKSQDTYDQLFVAQENLWRITTQNMNRIKVSL